MKLNVETLDVLLKPFPSKLSVSIIVWKVDSVLHLKFLHPLLCSGTYSPTPPYPFFSRGGGGGEGGSLKKWDDFFICSMAARMLKMNIV